MPTLPPKALKRIYEMASNENLGLSVLVAMQLTVLCFLLFLSLHKDVVGDGVAGIVNPDKEQQQRCSSNGKQRLAQMGASGECRYCQNCVRRKRQQNMKQPVLELRFVCRLQPHTTSHNG